MCSLSAYASYNTERRLRMTRDPDTITSAELVDKLAHDHDPAVRRSLAFFAGSQLPSRTVYELLNDTSESVAWMMLARCSSGALIEFVWTNFPTMVSRAAEAISVNPATPAELLHALYVSGQGGGHVLANPNTGSATLALAARIGCDDERAAVAEHPNVSVETLLELAGVADIHLETAATPAPAA